VCRLAAPDLVEIYNDYKDRDVVFVSLCREERETAESFAATFGMTWLFGYKAGITIEKLVGVEPCVFVIDQQARITWHDGCARLNHQVEALRSGLRSALDEVLGEP
jgi:hypothetical protein